MLIEPIVQASSKLSFAHQGGARHQFIYALPITQNWTNRINKIFWQLEVSEKY